MSILNNVFMIIQFFIIFAVYTVTLFILTLRSTQKRVFRKAGLLSFYIWFIVMIPVSEYIFRPGDNSFLYIFFNIFAVILLALPVAGPFLLRRFFESQ